VAGAQQSVAAEEVLARVVLELVQPLQHVLALAFQFAAIAVASARASVCSMERQLRVGLTPPCVAGINLAAGGEDVGWT
jgi:hypothetical protein